MAVTLEVQTELENYDRYVIPQLKETVSKAEDNRQNGNHDEVNRAFCLYTEQQTKAYRAELRLPRNIQTIDQALLYLLRRTIKRALYNPIKQTREKDYQNLLKREDLLKVGFAGLGRIQHVDANTVLQANPHGPWAPVFERITQVGNLYQRLTPETLVPWTIREAGIHWLSEIAQDTAKTTEILGRDPRPILQKAIRNTESTLRFLKHRSISTLIESNKYQTFKDRKLQTGSLSALGVLYNRLAVSDKNLGALIQAVQYIENACKHEPNVHRLATLSARLLAVSYSKEYQIRPPLYYTRETAFMTGIVGLALAVRYNPRDTFSALRQAVRKKL